MAPRVVFGPFAFDRDELTLWQNGVAIALAPKVAEALGILLAEPGALVSKERLRDTLWPEGFVEDGNLTQTIYLLRKALDPEGDGRAYIDTIPRRGYRFVAPFTLVEPPPPPKRGFALPPKMIRWRLAVATAIVVLLLSASVYSVAHSRTRLYPGLSAESSRAYALGHYYWNMRTLDATKKSIAFFEDVIRLSPQSPLGYAGLAGSYLMIANHSMVSGDLKPYYAKAEEYAREALARDPQSGEAIAIGGFVAYDRDHNRDYADRQLRQAVALRPMDPSAHEFLGVIDMEKGNVAEANDELKRAAELEPTSEPILCWLGESYYYAHQFDEARRSLQQAIEVDQTDEGAPQFYLVLTDERLGLTNEAMSLIAGQRKKIDTMLAKTHQHEGDEPVTKASMVAELDAMTALVALRAGDEATARRIAPDLKPNAKRKVDVLVYAALAWRLGRHDDAVEWLRIGIHDKKMGWMTRSLLPHDPQLTDAVADDRVRKLLTT